MKKAIALLTLAGLATSAQAAILLVDTGFAFTNTSGNASANLSKDAAAPPDTGFLFTHSYDAGASFDMLVVTVSRESGVGGTFSVSYDNVGMNLATGALTGSGVSIFYLNTTATTGNIVLDFTNFGNNGVGIGIAAIKSDNGDPISLHDADSVTGGTNTSGITTIAIDTADDSFTMWAVDTNLGNFDNLIPNQIVKNTDIGSNGYAAAYELVTTGQNGDTYSYNFTGAVPSTQAARSIAAANFVVVPEPGAALLASLGLLCLLRRRR
jgi:hypothetical protein